MGRERDAGGAAVLWSDRVTPRDLQPPAGAPEELGWAPRPRVQPVGSAAAEAAGWKHHADVVGTAALSRRGRLLPRRRRPSERRRGATWRGGGGST